MITLSLVTTFFILFFCVMIFLLLTKKGTNILLKNIYGDIIKDYGDIGSSKIRGDTTHTLHLYKCSKKEEIFFVLEVRTVLYVQYIKISNETAQNFIKIISLETQNSPK